MTEMPTSEMANRNEQPPPMPTWVKIFGIVGLVLVLLFIILHLAGRGLGGHMP